MVQSAQRYPKKLHTVKTKRKRKTQKVETLDFGLCK